MADTTIDTQQIRDALGQLSDVFHILTSARNDALDSARALHAAWQSTNAAPNFQKALNDLIGTDPNDPSEGGQAGADPHHDTVNIAVLINDIQSMMQYLQEGIADHEAADKKL